MSALPLLGLAKYSEVFKSAIISAYVQPQRGVLMKPSP